MDSPDFIVPPPHLIPPRHDTGTETVRVPSRERSLPVFAPPAAAQAPTAAAPARQWRLLLPGGRAVPVTGTVLVGRNPVTFGAWTDAELVAVDDPAASVSKTHAAFEAHGDTLTVTDAHSTNGVVVVAEGQRERELTPGEPAPLAHGETVHLGRFAVHVELA
ncbi:FHA domain-containing protein [Leifsonia sp. NCR5]|uniref:FHA domain-containing protein n=1 Tax=Leifsonia sp. NCR5 TaxID=1978342 RepID=UPI000A18D745|nr:FHA domain-containing protein [Leifsonia sp. NCR5]